MERKVKIAVKVKTNNTKTQTKIVNQKIKIKNVGYKIYEIIEVGTIELGIQNW